MSVDYPKMSITQFAVSFVELETGTLLNKDFERYIGQGECFYVFDSFEEAESFCIKSVKENQNFQGTIYSHDQSFVKIITDENYYKNNALKTKSKKKWSTFK
ncbi:MAG TPA: hypothetical protein VF941_06440 [Clostridia bacterium]